MALRKAVITTAGLGTRLLPVTKELPREMLPIYTTGKTELVLKPLVQALFEQLYRFGLREFCFVVGLGERAIEDHLCPDWDYMTKFAPIAECCCWRIPSLSGMSVFHLWRTNQHFSMLKNEL